VRQGLAGQRRAPRMGAGHSNASSARSETVTPFLWRASRPVERE
jgi:hypothetical protein